MAIKITKNVSIAVLVNPNVQIMQYMKEVLNGRFLMELPSKEVLHFLMVQFWMLM
jgi:hypothetical protein